MRPVAMRASFLLLALALSQPVLADAERRQTYVADDRKNLLGDCRGCGRTAPPLSVISALFYSDYACNTVALNVTGDGVRLGATKIFFAHLANNSSASVQADRVSSWVYPLRDGDLVDVDEVSNVIKLFFSRDDGYPSVTVTPPFATTPGVCAPITATFDMAVDGVFINSYKFLYV
jgi:hypothetical protein